MTEEKVRENRLRRMAERQGLKIMRSRRRDPLAFDFGGYMVADIATDSVVYGGSPNAFSGDLDGIERLLTKGTRPAPSSAKKRRK